MLGFRCESEVFNSFQVQQRVDYKTNYNYTALQVKHGLFFENVKDDFIDNPLYLDYIF